MTKRNAGITAQKSGSKRSRKVMLTSMSMVAAGSVLASCGDGATTPAANAIPSEELAEVEVFSNIFDCKANSEYTDEECQAAYDEAVLAAKEEGPRYESDADCETEFGAGKCVEQRAGGRSYFSPFIAGFFLRNALGGGNARNFAPLYSKSSSGGYFTSTGQQMRPGGANGKYLASTKALAAPKSAPAMKSASKVASRGGFGPQGKSSWFVGGNSGSSARSMGG